MEVIWEFGTELSVPGMYSATIVNGSPLNSQAETNLVLESV